jgi:hypothetical protein
MAFVIVYDAAVLSPAPLRDRPVPARRADAAARTGSMLALTAAGTSERVPTPADAQIWRGPGVLPA